MPLGFILAGLARQLNFGIPQLSRSGLGQWGACLVSFLGEGKGEGRERKLTKCEAKPPRKVASPLPFRWAINNFALI